MRSGYACRSLLVRESHSLAAIRTVDSRDQPDQPIDPNRRATADLAVRALPRLVGLTMPNTNTTIIVTGDPLPTLLARSRANSAADGRRVR
jgi:hypothetical protein